ncbi:MAG: CRISPR-associated endonuclease Cas2 [Clostridiales bacterium]|nr:CRISPR-associated endonuclease Cas2 [Clostridiales bacterium]
MAFRNVIVENDAELSLKDNQLDDGYHMLQYSIYVRTCAGMDSVNMHKKRLYDRLPVNGSVRLLTITEKQYASIEILLGPLMEPDESHETETLSIF